MTDTILADIKARLSGETVDYGSWHDLNDYACFRLGWITTEIQMSNQDVVENARVNNRPDLLIPVALSMKPEGATLLIETFESGQCNASVCVNGPSHIVVQYPAHATYPAAALALAVIEARM